MSETPKCPYCGDKMILHIFPHKYHAPLTSAWYQCVTCDSVSPRLEFSRSCATSNIEETTLAVTLRRIEPKNNHALTLEEVSAHCAEGEDAMPLWLENRKKKDVSRWMLTDTPEFVCDSRMTVKYLLDTKMQGYGETWRCWLRKPTEEEMEGTPWA